MSVTVFKAILLPWKKNLYANLDAQNLSMLRKDIPNFKGGRERSVVLCSVVFPEKVACSVGFSSCEPDIWSPCIHSPLES